MPGSPLIPGLVDPSEMTDDRQFSMNLARGLQVLRVFTADAPVLGNREIANRTNLPKATVSRLTYTLTMLGYLARVEPVQKFRLGAGVLSIGHPLIATLTIRQIARPVMQRLALQTRATVNLGMRDRLSVVYVESARADTANTYQPEIGATRPLLRSSIGRALLLGAEAAERTAILNSLRVHQPDTHEADLALWTRDVNEFASRGFTLSKGEWRGDIHAIAVPIRQPAGWDRVALNCATSAHRLKGGACVEQHAPLLLEAAREIEAAVGLF